jgi:nitrate reductase cytochrome c-type subunit
MCDYKQYPKNWKSEIVPRIRARAGNCCESCGLANGFVKENGSKIILTTAHLDHDHWNESISDDRLRYWCQKCHLKYDRTSHLCKRKYGKLYVKNNYSLNL